MMARTMMGEKMRRRSYHTGVTTRRGRRAI
jgi:hypothetical protein